MHLIPEARVPEHIGSCIANTGASFAAAAAYLLFALMLIAMVGEFRRIPPDCAHLFLTSTGVSWLCRGGSSKFEVYKFMTADGREGRGRSSS